MEGGKQEPESYSVAVVPFVKTTAPVDIGGVTFRPSEDTEGLSNATARSVTEVTEMLFLQEDLQIKSASYCVLPFVDLEHPGTALEKLRRIQDIVAYCYAIPHHIFGDPHLRCARNITSNRNHQIARWRLMSAKK